MELSPLQREQAFSGSVAVRAMNRNLWLLVFGPWSLADLSRRPFGMQGFVRELSADRLEMMIRRASAEESHFPYATRPVPDHETDKGDEAAEDARSAHVNRKPAYSRSVSPYYDRLWHWINQREGEDISVGYDLWQDVDSIVIAGMPFTGEQLDEVMEWIEHFRHSIPDVLVIHQQNVFDEMARAAHASLTALGAFKSPFQEHFAEHMQGFFWNKHKQN